MPSSKLIPLTSPTRKYLRYILSFVVTFGVGLVPLWGGKVIPGFHAILDVYPTIGFLMLKEATKAQPAKVAGFRT